MKRFLLVLVVFALCVPTAFWPALAQSATEPKVTTYQDWVVVCVDQEKKKVCTMHQTQEFKSEKASGRLLRATVGTTGDGVLIMELVLPLGLDLRPGIALQVDDKPEMKAPFMTCTNDGCLVAIRLNDSMLASLKAGAVARIGARPFGMDQTMVLDISLKGFTRAYRDIQ